MISHEMRAALLYIGRWMYEEKRYQHKDINYAYLQVSYVRETLGDGVSPHLFTGWLDIFKSAQEYIKNWSDADLRALAVIGWLLADPRLLDKQAIDIILSVANIASKIDPKLNQSINWQATAKYVIDKLEVEHDNTKVEINMNPRNVTWHNVATIHSYNTDLARTIEMVRKMYEKFEQHRIIIENINGKSREYKITVDVVR